MKKITVFLVLVLSFMNLTIVKAENINNEYEVIDVIVTADFEKTDYQGHAKKPEEITFRKEYQDADLNWQGEEDLYSLNKDNGYRMEFKGLKIYDEYTSYDFRLIQNSDMRYYHPKITYVDMTESGEVVFVFEKERTNVELMLQIGDLMNDYSQDCEYGASDGDDEGLFALYSLVNEDQLETSEVDDLSGAVFELLDGNNKTIHSATTDAKGKLTFEGVLYGEYKVKQISAPKGLKVDESLLNIDVYKEGDAEDCYGEISWYNELAPDEPIAEDPELEKPEVEKPEIEKPEIEKPEIEKSEVEKPEVKEPKEEKLETPNTGVPTTYLTYVLLLFLALLSLVIKAFIKIRKTNTAH